MANRLIRYVCYVRYFRYLRCIRLTVGYCTATFHALRLAAVFNR